VVNRKLVLLIAEGAEAKAVEAAALEALAPEAATPEARQENTDSLWYFKGRILDSLTGEALAFTHIVNPGRRRAVICDTLGYFYIRVRTHDTLKLSAIGYAPAQIIIVDSMRTLEKLPDILMRSVRYSIQAVMINPLGSYAAFRGRIANLELPPSRYEIHPTVLAEIERETDIIPSGTISPITALYNWLSKEGKSRRKLARLIEQEQFEKDISYKYSPLIVSGITGYSGFELYSFMEFCSFKKKFLTEADRYEIRDAVLRKQEIFEALKKDN
jgi:hypothetical protein